MVDRLLNVSSLTLVVLTVVFSQFMDAEKFWQGNAVDIEVSLLEGKYDDGTRRELERKAREFDSYHVAQKKYGQVFAGLMAVVTFITMICIPIEGWRGTSLGLKAVIVALMSCLGLLGSLGFLFAFGWWAP